MKSRRIFRVKILMVALKVLPNQVYNPWTFYISSLFLAVSVGRTSISITFDWSQEGIEYLFGIIAPFLKDKFGYSQTEVNFIGNMGNFGGYIKSDELHKFIIG